VNKVNHDKRDNNGAGRVGLSRAQVT